MKGSTFRRLIYGAVLFTVAVTYSLILFLVKKNFSVGNWISYGCVLFAFLALFLDTWMPSGKRRDFSMFGVSVTEQILAFFLVELLLFGIILMPFTFISWKVILALQLILFLSTGIVLAVIAMHKSVLEEHAGVVQQKSGALDALYVRLSAVQGSIPGDCQREFMRLMEDIKYSDPMSPPELTLTDEKLKVEILELAEAASSGDTSGMRGRIQHALNSIKVRNEMCKNLK